MVYERDREIAEQSSRETAWAAKFDDERRHFWMRTYNQRRRLLLQSRRRIRCLRSERDALQRTLAEALKGNEWLENLAWLLVEHGEKTVIMRYRPHSERFLPSQVSGASFAECVDKAMKEGR